MARRLVQSIFLLAGRDNLTVKMMDRGVRQPGFQQMVELEGVLAADAGTVRLVVFIQRTDAVDKKHRTWGARRWSRAPLRR